MATVVILLPLALALLFPLVGAAILHRRWSRKAGAARGRRGRVRRAAVCFALGLAGTAVLLSPLMMTGRWCRATPRGETGAADSFVVFGFGMGRENAGRSNRALAEWVVANNPERKPVVAQEGIYRALAELSQSRPGCLDGWTIHRLPEHDGVYVDTTGAAFQADAGLDREKLVKPVLVAHDLQLRRMVWAFEDIGIREAVVPDLPPTPFDPDSVQHAGTRWESVWLARQAFAARPLTLRSQGSLVVVETHARPLYKSVTVRTITDKEATRVGVIKGVNWLRQEMTQKDVGIVFFAGHGEIDTDGSLYFLPWTPTPPTCRRRPSRPSKSRRRWSPCPAAWCGCLTPATPGPPTPQRGGAVR